MEKSNIIHVVPVVIIEPFYLAKKRTQRARKILRLFRAQKNRETLVFELTPQ